MDDLGPFGQLLGDYGPWAMIVLLLASGIGIPVGEEVVNVPAGILVGQGTMQAIPTFIAAYVGVLGGDFLWFAFCRKFGSGLLRRRWARRFVHPRRLLEAKHNFDVRGAYVLLLARFIPGSRTPAITIAGFLRMGWLRFSAIEIITCLFTIPFQVAVGILIGSQLVGASLQTALFTALAVIASILALTALFNWWRLNKKRTGQAPRARLRWLRGK